MNGTSPKPSRMIPLAIVLLAALACPAFPEDIRTLTKRAEGGDAIAQYNLGNEYASGQGVPKDFTLAYFWFSLSASGSTGEDYARRVQERDYNAKGLTPEELMKVQQMTREWEAAHPGK